MKKQRFEKIVEWEYPKYFLWVYIIVLLSFIQGMILAHNIPEASLPYSFGFMGVAAIILFVSFIFLIIGFMYLFMKIERKVYWRKLK